MSHSFDGEGVYNDIKVSQKYLYLRDDDVDKLLENEDTSPINLWRYNGSIDMESIRRKIDNFVKGVEKEVYNRIINDTQYVVSVQKYDKIRNELFSVKQELDNLKSRAVDHSLPR